MDYLDMFHCLLSPLFLPLQTPGNFFYYMVEILYKDTVEGPGNMFYQ